MKGIYLTQEGKKEIEAKIANLKKSEEVNLRTRFMMGADMNGGFIDALETILLSATVLPVEESWEDVELYPPDNESQFEKTISLKNGVIIKPKES
jgi:hypothetical protein